MLQVYRRYDHATKLAVAYSGNIKLFPDQNIPKSTAKHWVRSHIGILENSSDHAKQIASLKAEIQNLKSAMSIAQATLDFIQKVYAAFNINVARVELPNADKKLDVLKAIDQGRKIMKLKTCLSLVGLTKTRYLRWKKRHKDCCLEDYSRCPKTQVAQLTFKEVKIMKDLFSDKSLSHMSIPSLCLYAKRHDQLYCSEETWRKYIDRFKWSRPRIRVYPKKPKIGVRASRPNEIWHMDVTQIKLIDNTKYYIQAIIDNYSRYILSWRIEKTRNGYISKKTINEAVEKFRLHTKTETVPNLFVDDGSENNNSHVEKLVTDQAITKTIAQIDVSFSNSMIEAFFRSLKHNHLFNVELNTEKELFKQVKFYVEEHNNRVPQKILSSATPFEKFTAQWTTNDEYKLAVKQKKAISDRIKFNQSIECQVS